MVLCGWSDDVLGYNCFLLPVTDQDYAGCVLALMAALAILDVHKNPGFFPMFDFLATTN
jgi:hypothetical protein